MDVEDSRLSSLSDTDLLALAAGGDEAAFVALYRRRQAKVYRFALQMSGSSSVAEDVTQEVFMSLVRLNSGYDPARGSLESFLYGVARNHVLRRFAAEKRYVPIPDDPDAMLCIPAPESSPLSELSRQERVESVRRAILSLPEHYREVIVLCELHEMSYMDASGVLGCAVGTVRSRLHRARRMLVDKLKNAPELDRQDDLARPAGCLI